ncbi:helix-turn-helix domain-containing protein [Nocardia farcinica]|uniref:helix-turn-helix domain-containing protein n=1 Tax=Nocardia farcinica TaxID=37329 RepID=UPI00097053CE|nr:helix-turn-helix transcriptional regulator [Nocardia farcinica]AXK88879.1 XRE family transcriptional regulator [Nocardia farcinica]MBA4858008.1 helix-turn-helix transcriptional regulator [Nocardia farcinica]MBC9819461.1 helix-turn-helix transcriptional regulator [Nocardia farcinica]MBF6410938.1 helix-turn-helix transcriptional regulator [Nocardia farcinica]
MGNSASAQHIAAELRAARARRKLTQAELAERAGLHVNSVARLERGERDAKVGQILALASALGVEPHIFLESLPVEGKGDRRAG